MDKLSHIKHCIFHPFEGFYDAKYRNKGSVPLAFLLFAVYGIVCCVGVQYTGFLMNTFHISRMSSLTTFISSITVFFLFTLSNWTVTTLFEGKGRMRDILIVTAYSLVPVIFCRLIVIFLSNYVIAGEIPILNTFTAIGWVWFGFMMLSGLCTIHEYGLAKNIVTLLATLAAGAIVLFLFVLFISLIEQMIGFFTTFFGELGRRI